MTKVTPYALISVLKKRRVNCLVPNHQWDVHHQWYCHCLLCDIHLQAPCAGISSTDRVQTAQQASLDSKDSTNIAPSKNTE